MHGAFSLAMRDAAISPKRHCMPVVHVAEVEGAAGGGVPSHPLFLGPPHFIAAP